MGKSSHVLTRALLSFACLQISNEFEEPFSIGSSVVQKKSTKKINK